MSKYKVGDVIQFGDEWLLILDQPKVPNVTIEKYTLFLGRYNPITDYDGTFENRVLFNIFDIKKRIENNE